MSQGGTKYHHHNSQIVLSDFDQAAPSKPMSDQQVSALSDLQQRILQQNKEMDQLQLQQAQARAPPAAPPKLKSMDPSSVDANQSSAPRRDISGTRRNEPSNFRHAGEQAILRNSTMNNRVLKMETAPRQDFPTGAANLPPSGKSGPATGPAGRPPLAAENVRSLAGPANPPDVFELEPIENYKGKSVGELEAILDAHNAAQARKRALAEE